MTVKDHGVPPQYGVVMWTITDNEKGPAGPENIIDLMQDGAWGMHLDKHQMHHPVTQSQ